MKVLILGYGKMGKTIESILTTKGHEVVIADTPEERDALQPVGIDVAIEFSVPTAAFENIRFCLKHAIPVVSGTTGWLDRKGEVEELCIKQEGTFFYASNFSIGVNLFFQLNKKFAAVMNRFDTYNVSMKEVHHIHKLDSPSGTAITLVNGLIENMDRKESWIENDGSGNDRHSPASEEIEIQSFREGEVPGTHTIEYTGDHDRLILTHEAKSRAGFAYGAVEVAEWVVGKTGVLTMEDYLGNLMG